MNNQKFIIHIRDHIANNQLDTALQLLHDLLDNSPQLDEVIQQAGRYASIRQQIRLGTVSHADATLTENQIRMGLIELLGEIERQEVKSHLREEMERAVISIQHSKNVNTGNIQADNVNIGDKTTINIKGIWVGIALLLVGLLGLGIWQKDVIKQSLGHDRIFNKNDENFKILILPFKSLCEYEGKQYDVGYVIQQRLEGIIADESLKVMPSYFKDYDFKNFNDIKAKELQEYHYADMIVYGSYQTDDCSSEGDKICLNYMTDQKWNLGEMSTDLDRNYQSGGLDELQKGKIQEKVEDIATFLSVIAQQKNIDHERYMEIMQKFLEDKDTGDYTKADTYIRLADQLKAEGKLDEVFDLYQKALDIYKAEDDKRKIGLCYQRIGSIYTDLGELDKALTFFEQYNELEKQLYEAYPSNVNFKNGLAISYSKLGETHTALGNLNKALNFFELRSELGKQLYEAYPSNVNFKNGLAISYSKLGETHTALGNLNKALNFFEQYNEFKKQLYEAYPSNVNFKNGLAISYAKLGVFNKNQLKDNKQAKVYFQQAHDLWEELTNDYPAYVEFQRNLKNIKRDLEGL